MQALQSAVPCGSTTKHVSIDPSWMIQPQPLSDSSSIGDPEEELCTRAQVLPEPGTRKMRQTVVLRCCQLGLVCSVATMYTSTIPLLRNIHGQQRISIAHHCPLVVQVLFPQKSCSWERDRRDISLSYDSQSLDFWHCLWHRGRHEVSTLLIIRLIVWLLSCCFSLYTQDHYDDGSYDTQFYTYHTLNSGLHWPNFAFVFFNYMCMLVGTYAHLCIPEEGVRDPGAVVTSGCKRTNVGVGNWTQVLCKKIVCTLNH